MKQVPLTKKQLEVVDKVAANTKWLYPTVRIALLLIFAFAVLGVEACDNIFTFLTVVLLFMTFVPTHKQAVARFSKETRAQKISKWTMRTVFIIGAVAAGWWYIAIAWIVIVISGAIQSSSSKESEFVTFEVPIIISPLFERYLLAEGIPVRQKQSQRNMTTEFEIPREQLQWLRTRIQIDHPDWCGGQIVVKDQYSMSAL